jgi:ubiquinone/menaquinone biosynthesis C-methylase UbiE
MSEDRKAHWEQVYATKEPAAVSWYQPVPEKSLELIRATGVPPTAPILDVGGGASTLVDHLLDDGFTDITILDVAASAFTQPRKRLGKRADDATWIESDVTEFEPSRPYAIWHDRAVFHFLTDAVDRERYLVALRRTLQADGHFLLATFGPEGPLRCSGLEIRRYSVGRLQDFLGSDFQLYAHEIDEHRTPTGSMQQFLYSCWRLAG